ncbi:MAG: hypothetical protein Q4P07_11800 [Ornithinimicrobium sp.]|uniref:hypothetical protein n=1 Tax=Ornithinimicrobium sp. TaxID=1977084 RepID=UPI0026DEBE5B|nr:hypothetical protein [Ornithinimicrobium sp.]MDO5740816.1 hypothetical protein [Ornithinimicrobium sp.]
MNVAFRLLVAAALVVDAVVHVHLAANYQLAAPGGIGAGNIFRIQAAIAVLAAIYVLARGSRRAFIVAGLVTVSAFAAVMVYRYIDIPAIGPIPAMYEPIWFAEKTLSAVAEAAGTVLAGLAVVTATRPRRPARPTTVELSPSEADASTLKDEPPAVDSRVGFAHWAN